MDVITRCVPTNMPFSYLGLPVGAYMNHIVNWNMMIQKFEKRLANWKVNLLFLEVGSH